jgi:ankyrin repeat protein
LISAGGAAQADIVKILLDAGVNVNSVNHLEWTPLRTLDVILAAGPNLQAKTRHGDTSLEIAQRYNNIAIANKLIAAGAEDNPESNNFLLPSSALPANSMWDTPIRDTAQFLGTYHQHLLLSQVPPMVPQNQVTTVSTYLAIGLGT